MHEDGTRTRGEREQVADRVTVGQEMRNRQKSTLRWGQMPKLSTDPGSNHGVRRTLWHYLHTAAIYPRAAGCRRNSTPLTSHLTAK